MDSSTLTANAGSIARLVAGVVGGVLTSKGIAVESGSLETIIGAVLVAVAGVWAIIKNVKSAQAKTSAAGSSETAKEETKA